MFFLMPRGGSVVTLTLFCRRVMGNLELGSVDRNNLKLSFTSFFSISSYSNIFSRFFRKLRERWQLAKNNHCPYLLPSKMVLLAISSCPLPNDTLTNYLLYYLANTSRFLRGSTPGAKIKITGVFLPLS